MSIAKATESTFRPNIDKLIERKYPKLLDALAGQNGLVVAHERTNGGNGDGYVHPHFVYLTEEKQSFVPPKDYLQVLAPFLKSPSGKDASIKTPGSKENVSFSEVLESLFESLLMTEKTERAVHYLYNDIERTKGKIVTSNARSGNTFRRESPLLLPSDGPSVIFDKLVNAIKLSFAQALSPSITAEDVAKKNSKYDQVAKAFRRNVRIKPVTLGDQERSLPLFAQELAQQILNLETEKPRGISELNTFSVNNGNIPNEFMQGLPKGSGRYVDRIRFFLPEDGTSLVDNFFRTSLALENKPQYLNGIYPADRTVQKTPPAYQVRKSSLNSLTLADVPKSFQSHFEEIKRIGQVLEALNAVHSSEESFNKTMKALSPTWA